jgi:hypothetical protein
MNSDYLVNHNLNKLPKPAIKESDHPQPNF